MSSANALLTRRAVEDLIYASCLQLDQRRFDAFLGLTAPEFRYRIEAYSPEIRKDMTWLDHDREGLKALLDILPKHHVDNAVWQRHAVVYQVQEEASDRVQTVTSLAVYQTQVDVGEVHLQAGATRVFAVGRYLDTLRLDGGEWRLVQRVVRLDTRQLGIGTHMIV